MTNPEHATLRTPTDPLERVAFPWKSLVLFVGLLLLAVLCLILRKKLENELNPAAIGMSVLEHGSSALIVASMIGLSYELLLHYNREATFRQLFRKQREATFNALSAYMILKPQQIFQLLEDIATQTERIPTLYNPPRKAGKEFLFAHSKEYFDQLVLGAKDEVVKALDSWIQDKSNPHLKFLASDFIGRYRLFDLADTLRIKGQEELSAAKLSDLDHSWVLNYIWAASRCEIPPYRLLERVLIDYADNDFIQEWILFVPLQMQDPELCDLLGSYLDQRGDSISDENKIRVAKALAALARADVKKARTVLSNHRDLYNTPHLRDEVRNAWRGLQIPRGFQTS